MNTTSGPSEQTDTAMKRSGDGSYDSSALEAEPLKVRLGDHLDSAMSKSLHAAQRATPPAIEFIKRNSLALMLAAGGIIWLLSSQRRRFDRPWSQRWR